MGIQLYENLLDMASTKENKDTHSYEIIDGSKTSALIEIILRRVIEWSQYKDLVKAIEFFLDGGKIEYTNRDDEKETVTLKSGKDDNGNYTMENFLKRMQGDFFYGAKDRKTKNLIKKQVHTPATYDIKEFLSKQGNQINIERNLAELFMDKEKIAQRTLEAARNIPDIDDRRAQYPKSYLDTQRNLDSKLSTAEGRKNLRTQLEDKADEVEIKKDLQDKIFTTVCSITDYIFFNLGEDTEAWANMFAQNIGFSQTRFKNKETFRRNEQQIRDAL